MCKPKIECEQNDWAAWQPNQCNPIVRASSVCHCCCSDNDGCNEEDYFCLESPRCPEIMKTPNLEYACSNDANLESKCTFSCVNSAPEKYDLELVGSETTSCKMLDVGAMWTLKQPYCKRIYKCPLENTPSALFMTQSCTNGNLVQSTCSFSCPPNHRYVGPVSRTCQQAGDMARWDNDFGKCESVCTVVPELSNGRYFCTDLNFIGSECTFECNDGYALNGASTTICTHVHSLSTDSMEAGWVTNGPEPRCDPLCDDVDKPANGPLKVNIEVPCSDRTDLRRDTSSARSYDAVIDFQAWVAEKCGPDVDECDANNECLQDTLVEIFKLETVDGTKTFQDSYKKRCGMNIEIA